MQPLLKRNGATWSVVALLVLLTFARPVVADVSPSPADAERKARADYAEGVTLAGRKQWREAEQRFARVVAFRPAPPALLALGRAQLENGKLATAKATLAQAAASSDHAYASVVAQARQTLAELEPRVPRLELLLPDGVQASRVVIDGAPAPNAGPSELDPGVVHQVSVDVEGYQPVRMTVTLSEGERRSIQVALVPVHAEKPVGAAERANVSRDVPPTPRATPVVAGKPKPDSEYHAVHPGVSGRSYIGPQILGAVGFTAGIIGLYVRFSAQATYDRASTDCKLECTDPAVVQRGNDARGRMVVGTVVGGVGVAALVGAGVWWLALSSAPARSSSLRFGVTAVGAGAMGVVGGRL